MLGYEVLRRTLRSCAQGATRVTPSSGRHLNNAGVSRFRCSYLQCPLNHDVCVTSCFDPDTQVNIFILCSFVTLCETFFSPFVNMKECLFDKILCYTYIILYVNPELVNHRYITAFNASIQNSTKEKLFTVYCGNHDTHT